MARSSRFPWGPRSLRRRIQFLLAGIIFLILLGQTLLAFASELADLDHRVTTEGIILAQGIAVSATPLIEAGNPERFSNIIRRVSEKVDLVELAILDRNGRTLGHSDPTRVGQQHPEQPFDVFGQPRVRPGLVRLLQGSIEHRVSAPMLRGSTFIGSVILRFRSHRIAERAGHLLRSVALAGLLWLAIGAAVGTLFIRRMTSPLTSLTEAVQAVADGRLDQARIEATDRRDEVGVLQSSFRRLLAALGAQREENTRLLGELEEKNVQLRQRVEEVTAELRETNAYLQSVITCLDEGIITCDRDGEIVQVNPGAERQLRGLGVPTPGDPIDRVIPDGTLLLDAVTEATRFGTRSHVRVERASTTGPWDDWHPTDAALVRGQRTLLFRVYPLQGAGTDGSGAVVTVMDETEQRKVEARLRRHDRLISLGTLATGLAHELGNTMHAIGGFSSLLVQALPEAHPNRPDADAIHRENARAVALLDRFLQFARPGQVRFNLEPVDALILETLRICAVRLRQIDVQTETRFEAPDQEIRCDGHLLMQVFMNLVLNAADAMMDRPRRELVVRTARRSDTHLEISFQDSGTGIKPEHRDRVFDPFFTTKEASGTGLGLSIAHQIIDRHQGTISVESREGEGTTFRIVLPIDGPKGEGT